MRSNKVKVDPVKSKTLKTKKIEDNKIAEDQFIEPDFSTLYQVLKYLQKNPKLMAHRTHKYSTEE